MNTLTCHEAEELLDLHAAGECDDARSTALDQHLAGCPACSRKFVDAVQLMDGLDWHHRADEALDRLLDTLDAQPLPLKLRARRPTRGFIGRLVAAAALVLVSLGLTRAPEPGRPDVLDWAGSDKERVDLGPNVPAPAHARAPQHTLQVALDLRGMSREEYVQSLSSPAPKRSTSAPPEVRLSLEVVNPRDTDSVLDLISTETRLTLELRGPGVLRTPLPGRTRLFDKGVTVPRRSTARVPLRRLVGGTKESAYALYWTQPGTYRLTARLTVPERVGDMTRLREFVLPPVTIDVRAAGD